MVTIRALWLLLFFCIYQKTSAIEADFSCFYEARPMLDVFCPGSKRLYIGEFIKDKYRKDDLFCHDKKQSTIEMLSLPNNHQEQSIRRKQKLKFCNDDHSNLLIGDFNGDGRSDLICQQSDNTLKIVHADNQGRFHDIDKRVGNTKESMCPYSSSLHIGDINGDKREDIICHHRNGSFSYSHALPNGTFTDIFYINIAWCGGKTSELFLGNFNNDGRKDMLCHDRKTGFKSILLTAVDGHLKAGWTSDNDMMKWCIGKTSFITIGDVNGDRLEDLICKDTRPFGTTLVAQNKQDQYFRSGNTHQLNFCLNSGKSNFFMGDFNGDGRSDLLCQTAMGTRTISISHCY